jgi:hypothetical protein
MPVASTYGMSGTPARFYFIFALWVLPCSFMLLSLFFVGFQASDDANYLSGALGWLEHFPFIGDSHWTLRHTITLPTAAAVAILGLDRFPVSLSNICYFEALLLVNGYFTCRYFGLTCALIVAFLMLTIPGFLVVSTYLNPDIAEVFFTTTAFWCLTVALESERKAWQWFAVGVVAGLGFLNRQTAVAFVIYAALLFAIRPGARRSRYVLIACAFLMVVGGEWLLLTVGTGDPLYRTRVDFNHDPVDRFAEAARVSAEGLWIDKEGNISVNVFIDPILNLFVSQKYALIFWAAIPALICIWRQPKSDAIRILAGVAGLGAVSFLFVAANPKLYLVPRYFASTAWAAIMLTGWWLAQLWSAGQRGRAGLVATLLVGANAAALSVENLHPRAAEQSLVRWVQAQPGEKIFTDIETRMRSDYFFRFARLPSGVVIAEAPPVGARYFYSANRIQQCAKAPRCREHMAKFQPNPRWEVIERIEAPRRPGGQLISALHMEKMLPSDIAKKLVAPVDEIVIYKVR